MESVLAVVFGICLAAAIASVVLKPEHQKEEKVLRLTTMNPIEDEAAHKEVFRTYSMHEDLWNAIGDQIDEQVLYCMRKAIDPEESPAVRESASGGACALLDLRDILAELIAEGRHALEQEEGGAK